MNGFGILISMNGNKYEGQFKDGLMDGKGVTMEAKGGVYEGEYK